MKAILSALSIATVLFLLLWTATAPNHAENAEMAAARLFDRVMSPYCPGRTLSTCGSSAAEALRQEIARDLASGRSADDVEKALYQRFGNSIRGVPEGRGVGLIAWVVPAALLLATAAWLMAWLRMRSGRAAAASAAADEEPPTQELLDRLDGELAEI